MTEQQLPLSIEVPVSFKVKEVIKRNGRTVAFNRSKIENAITKAALGVGGSDRELASRLTDQVIALMNEAYPAGSVPTVEEIQDLIEKVLIENGHAKTAKAFILYRADHARIREKKDLAVVVEDNIPYKLLWRAYTWNVEHHCDTVAKLNRLLRGSRWKKLVLDAELHYHAEIRKVAENIARRKNEVRLMIVAGPSSSGKTTTTYKIGEALSERGVAFVTLNLDHYFQDLERHPRDEYGDYDFETPHALNLEMINDHLAALVKGKTVKMPHFDFKTGKRRDGAGREVKLEKGEIILVDSLHGLFADLTRSIAPEQKFKFYIEALCQIKDARGEFVRWTDLRILRRMTRDSWQRNYDPARTVGHWHYVRRSEKKHIVPFIREADAVFNGSLPYELCVYKNLMAGQIPAILKQYEGDPKKFDAYLRAQRLNDLLESLEPFPDLEFIPRNSFLREFIGGGIYQY